MTEYVYAIWAGSGPIKIGKAINVKARLSKIQTGSHKRLAVLKQWERPDHDAHKVEQLTHRALAKHRQAGEWFKCSPERVCDAVEQAIVIAETPEPPPPPVAVAPLKPVLTAEAQADLEWAKANPGQLAREIRKWYKDQIK